MQAPANDGECYRGHVTEVTINLTVQRGHAWFGPHEGEARNIQRTVRCFIPDPAFDPQNPTDYDITKSRLYKPWLLALATNRTSRLQTMEFNIDQLQGGREFFMKKLEAELENGESNDAVESS